MGRWLEAYQTPEEILMGKRRIKTISTSIIARFKSENADFDIDFDTFVKELLTDEVQLTRLFEILIKDSFKRTKRQSRSSPQGSSAPPSVLPVNGEARFARMIHEHQRMQARRLSRNTAELDHALSTTEGDPRYRITRSRSPMDIESPDRDSGPTREYSEDARVHTAAVLEEEKEEEGTVENRETGLGTVVVA